MGRDGILGVYAQKVRVVGEDNIMQKAFSLIETMIVCLIMAILTAIALPYYLSCVDRARELGGG